jgi:tetratricopeptide (TPR) repeat protein
VTGSGDYIVSVLADDGQDRPQIQVTGNRIDWPEGWPPLELGATYVLVVEGGGRLSNEGNEANAGLGFWLLMEDQTEVVNGLEERLRAQPLSPTAADLLVAELYRSHGLRAEAAALLEQLVDTDGAPAVWIALGDVYLEVGLALEAEEALEQALASAQGAGQQEAEATARVGLALTAQLQDDDASAQDHLLAAQALYEQIGDRARFEEVTRLLGE